MTGNLSQTSILEPLGSVLRNSLSGSLQIKQGKTVKTLVLNHGSLVDLESNDPGDDFGEFLLLVGRLSPDQLETARQTSARGGLIAALLEGNLFSPTELISFRTHQVEEIFCSMLNCTSGEFEFISKEVSGVPLDLKRKLPDLIFEGVRRLKVTEVLHRVLKSNSEVLRLSRDFEKRIADISLKPDEAFILSRLDSATRISDILLVSPLGLEVTQKILLGFLVTDVIEFVATTAGKGQESSQGTTANRASLDLQINRDNARPILNEESEEVRRDVFTTLDKAKNRNYYELLDVGPTASLDEIKKSYYSLAKKYHPDCYHQSTSQDFKEALDTIFSILSQGYETLKVPATRSSYDAKVFRLESSANVTEKSNSSASAAPPPQQKLAELNYRQGRSYFEQKDYWSAIQAFRQSVRMEPENPRYRYWLGMALSKNAKWRREAEEHFQKAIHLEQFAPDAYVGLGLLYQEAGMHKRAESQFKQALQVSPDNTAAQEALDLLLSAGAKKAKGLDSLKSLFKRNRADP